MLLVTKCSHLLFLKAAGCLQPAVLGLLQLFSLVQGCHLLFQTCKGRRAVVSPCLHMASQWRIDGKRVRSWWPTGHRLLPTSKRGSHKPPARLLTVYPVSLHLQKPLCLLQLEHELLLAFVHIWGAPDVAWSVACCRAGRLHVKTI